MKRLMVLTILAAIVALFGFALTHEAELPSRRIGKPAPVFSMPLLFSDSTAHLADYAGKPVVLNFWASWCFSCREEAEILEWGWQRHGEDVAYVGIAVNDTDATARAFARRYGKTFTLGTDARGSVAIDYGLHGVPETFFIGADGRVLARHIGPVTRGQLELQIEALKAGQVTGSVGDMNELTPLDGGTQ